MSEALRELSDQLICHPVSRSIAEIEAAGEAIKTLLEELQQAREERTALLVNEQNLTEELAALRKVIANDAYACSFENLFQYRTALLKDSK
jgi:hypothetical protein